MKASNTNKSRVSLINALATKDKDKIKKALGYKKKLKVFVFFHENEKIYIQKVHTEGEKGIDSRISKERIEISFEEKRAMIEESEKEFEVNVFSVIYTRQDKELLDKMNQDRIK